MQTLFEHGEIPSAHLYVPSLKRDPWMTGPSTTKDEEELVYCNAEFCFLREVIVIFSVIRKPG